MKKLFLLLAWATLAGTMLAVVQETNLQDYYRQIDDAINHSSEYA